VPRKGYIWPSKFPQTVPVFFVEKRIGRREWYKTINTLMSGQSNNYLLLLISDIIENIETKKVLTKLDLRWEYNNVRIKERYE